jgi:hypothetical protein
MGVTIRKRHAKSWRVTVCEGGQRQSLTVHSEADARQVVKMIYVQQIQGQNIIEALRGARQPAASTSAPMFNDAMHEWLRSAVASGDLRQSSATTYEHSSACSVGVSSLGLGSLKRGRQMRSLV